MTTFLALAIPLFFVGCGPNTPFTNKNALLARQMELQGGSDALELRSENPLSDQEVTRNPSVVATPPESPEGPTVPTLSAPAVRESTITRSTQELPSNLATRTYTEPAPPSLTITRKPIILDTGYSLVAAHLGGLGRPDLTSCTIEGGACVRPVSIDVSEDRMQGEWQLPLFLPRRGHCEYLAEIRYIEGEENQNIAIDSGAEVRPDHNHRFYHVTRNRTSEDLVDRPAWEDVIDTERENWLLFFFQEDLGDFGASNSEEGMEMSIQLNLEESQLILASLALLDSPNSIRLVAKENKPAVNSINKDTEVLFCPSGSSKTPLISGYINSRSKHVSQLFVALPHPYDA